MTTPYQTLVQIVEHHRQDLLAQAARDRLGRTARQTGPALPPATATPRRALTLAYARYALATLASVAFSLYSN
jgi:hypothetical protein